MTEELDITQAPSPNQDVRNLPITLLVMHYTGMESGVAALAHMQNPASKVCAHYMVEEDGRIFQLADENRRAWHAGVSSWEGVNDINSASVGIEIVNGGHDFGLPNFPEQQINSVITLSRSIIMRHNISDFGIVAHSDIAPSRKQDPGEKFPWSHLADAGIGIWPDTKCDDERVLFKDGMVGDNILVFKRALAFIGYGLTKTNKYDGETMLVVQALQRRYRPQKINGVVDVQTMQIISLLARYKNTTKTNK